MPTNPQKLSQTGALSISTLLNTRYTVVSPSVRRVLSSAGVGFVVDVRDGLGSFSRSADIAPFDTVRVSASTVAEGDLNRDGQPELVGVLSVGDDTEFSSEVVVLTLKDSTAKQIASYPIGRMHVQSLSIADGRVHVSIKDPLSQSVLQRTMDLSFSL